MVDSQVQEFNSLCSYMQQFNPDQFFEAISDFHLLLFIATMDMLPMKVPKLLLKIFSFKYVQLKLLHNKKYCDYI